MRRDDPVDLGNPPGRRPESGLDGKVKTADLGTGKVSWRFNPAKVNLRGKVEDIIARIKSAGEPYAKFLRATVEIDKVAMLRDPNLAASIDGVKIASAGETAASVSPSTSMTRTTVLLPNDRAR